MKLTRDQLLTALERSYDYYSARAVLAEVLSVLELDAKADVDAKDIPRVIDLLARQSRHAATIAAIEELSGIAPTPAPATPAPDDGAAKKAAADKAAADKAAADKAAADKAAADKAAADKAAAEKAAAEKAAAEKAAAEKKAAPAEAKPADKKAAAAAPAVVVALTGVPAEATDVLMVGGHSSFGDWKVPGGFPLKKQGKAWTGSLALDPGTTVEFKFVAKVGDGEAWEGGDNRTVTATDGEVKFDAAWQA